MNIKDLFLSRKTELISTFLFELMDSRTDILPFQHPKRNKQEGNQTVFLYIFPVLYRL